MAGTPLCMPHPSSNKIILVKLTPYIRPTCSVHNHVYLACCEGVAAVLSKAMGPYLLSALLFWIVLPNAAGKV